MKTYVCGHRNPDVDSVASAYGLADLRRRLGLDGVEAICAGALPVKAAWVFDHFGAPPPRVKRDVYVRVRDVLAPDVPVVDGASSLVDALRVLERSGESSLPVRGADGAFLGMLRPANLLNLFISKGDLSIPVQDAPLYRPSQPLLENEPLHAVRRAALRSSHNHFPVVDAAGNFVGTLLKRAFAEEPPVRMILVDHNETDQGIPGLDEVPVVEVVDHHRISFAPTREPIRYTADAVGSTCTLVARMFRGAGLRPTRETAGILLAGVVADTLLFQSPTTTDEDRARAVWLEKICGETAVAIMEGLSSVGSPLALGSADDALAQDAKTYREAGASFVLAQIEESNLALFHRHAAELGAALERRIAQDGLDFACLMVTDPVRGNSELLFRGDAGVERALSYRAGPDGTYLMPGVLSRKKQLLPAILACLA